LIVKIKNLKKKLNNKLVNSINHKFLLRALIIFNALFIFYENSFLFANNFSTISPITNNCLWVDYDSISDSSKVDSLLDFINSNKINRIFIETYNNGQFVFDKQKDINQNKMLDAEETSYTQEFSIDTSISDLDSSYNEFYNNIQKLRDNQIEVFAWVEAYRLWSQNYFPEDSLHIYYECKECLESDINGRSDKFIQLDKIQSLDWEGIYLSPIHPEVNHKIFNKLKSIIDINIFDGLVFDYLRYQNNFFGYNHIGIENFISSNQFDPRYLNKGILKRTFGYSKDELDSLQVVWDNYKTDKITDLLLLFNTYIEKNNLSFKIASKVKISPELSKSKWHQDWEYWIKNDIIDFVIADNKENDFFEFMYNYKYLLQFFNEDQLNNIIINLDLDEEPVYIANKILYLRLDNFNGISIYKYNNSLEFKDWYNPIYKIIKFNLNY